MAHKAGKKGKGQSLGAIEKKIAWIDVQHRKKMDEIKTIKKSSELKKRLQQKKKAKNDVADFETGNDLKLAFTPDYWIGKMDKISTITALTAVKHATTIN